MADFFEFILKLVKLFILGPIFYIYIGALPLLFLFLIVYLWKAGPQKTVEALLSLFNSPEQSKDLRYLFRLIAYLITFAAIISLIYTYLSLLTWVLNYNS